MKEDKEREYGRFATKMRTYAKVHIIKNNVNISFSGKKFRLVIVQKC
jgi:hypothetical protein